MLLRKIPAECAFLKKSPGEYVFKKVQLSVFLKKVFLSGFLF